ncbi:23S rRNA (adenine(2503)-C(2))-methyltransferase RlmN [candidate division KSB1 bacterium]|nr:23S rRNA (adenine(2503)-C(2))-methyltransferase RlmN [candidate division KSB1 bacterium]
MKNQKLSLTGLTRAELERFVVEWGEKPFRSRQLFSWIYAKNVRNFDQMTDLSKPLRQKLSTKAQIGLLELLEKKISPKSGSAKYLFELADGRNIESVYIPENDRRTVCISSQVGCGLRCRFCATGKLGFGRNLSAGEIVDQVLYVEHDQGVEISNVVFMGMGEPFMNTDAVLKAAALISHPDGLAIGRRHIVISTVGIVPEIERFTAENHRYKLALSLHAADDEKRRRLVPIARRYPLEDVIRVLTAYSAKSSSRPTIEYVLLDGVNDSRADALQLKKLLRSLPCKVNLIPYNPAVPGFNRPPDERIEAFASWLADLPAAVSIRWSKGDDIDAACGQLAARHSER